MDPLLESEPRLDMAAYVAWASQFIDFDLGECTAKAF
jgi:hypothetical protein